MLMLAGLGMLAGCGGDRANRPMNAQRAQTAGWRAVATSADRLRLREWRRTWLAAAAAARGHDGGALARDPALYAADRALNGAMPPPGAYRCRVIKLGRRGNSPTPGSARGGRRGRRCADDFTV